MGDDGLKGEVGFKGENGTVGPEGPTGVMGPQGDNVCLLTYRKCVSVYHNLCFLPMDTGH